MNVPAQQRSDNPFWKSPERGCWSYEPGVYGGSGLVIGPEADSVCEIPTEPANAWVSMTDRGTNVDLLSFSKWKG